jgi:ATP-binding cassette subfamily B protein
VTDGLITLVSSTLTLLGVVLILLFLDFQLALVTFATFPILAIGSVIFRIASAGAYRRTREKIANITAYLQETLSGVRVVRSFAQEPRHLRRMSRLNEENRQANMATVYLNAAYFPAVELLSAIGTGVILLYGGYLAVEGHIQIGVVVAFVGYLNAFFDPIQQISQLYTTYQQGMAALDKIFELLETEPDMVDKPGALDPGRIRGEIELDGVRFSYGGDAGMALDGIDLHVPAGQTVALVGETGAGKSTLAKLLTRQYDPQQGSISLGGVDLRDARLESLRHRIVMLPQEGHLFSGTIADNVRLADPEASDDAVLRALEQIGARDRFEALPDGINTDVQTRGVRLSAGERQLVGIARVALADPAVIVLDEATSSLDPATEAAVEQALAAVVEGRTVIIIAHRLSTAERADRVVVMDSGRVVESASHDELVAQGERYARLWASWQAGVAAGTV